jgi:CHAT domain-containing protein/Tfp pilus assembly protein PilF
MIQIAEKYKLDGDYVKAANIWKKLVAMSEKDLGANHPDTANALDHLARVYLEQGNYDEADLLCQRALAIRSEALGLEHPQTATSLNNLGMINEFRGNYYKAQHFYQRALAIYIKNQGLDHISTVTSLTNLASIYSRQGFYAKAEPLYQRAIAIRENVLGPEHPDVATLLESLAGHYYLLGLVAKAEPLALRSLAIREKVLGSLHPDTIGSLNILALLSQEQHFYRKAEMFYHRALAISEKIKGLGHPETATILDNLTQLYVDMRLYAKSRLLGARALAIREKALGSQHPNVAFSLNTLAVIASDQGFYPMAEKFYQRALTIREKALGHQHPLVAISLRNLARIFNAKGLHTKAELLARRALGINLTLIQQEAPSLPIGERQNYLNSTSFAYEYVFSYSHRGGGGPNLALLSRLNRQGLLEDIEKRQAQLASLPGQQQEVAEQLRAINKQISSLSLTPQQRKALKIRQGELEAQLYRLLPELKPRIVEVQQVAAALPAGGALLEYQRYQPFDGKKPRNQRWGKPRYLALVLKPAGSITAIDLGPAAVIEERIQQALRATQEQLSDANQLWGQVGKQVLDLLGPALKGVQTLFVSPDGELNRIPFAALPAPGGNALLGDALQLRLLTTGRELLDLAQPRSQAKTAALVVANPAFDQLASNASVLAVRPLDPVESPFGIGDQQRSADLGSLRWSALPGTAKEGQAIAALTGATLLSGSQASASAIEKQAAPRILHIASHGYFLANQPTSPSGKRGLSDSGLSPMGALPAANLQDESPLLRSGIVLAGANQNSTATGMNPGERGDDGYLTALEITQLDWKGTELVVVSACESGKGDIQAGEGVYGLKRAIAVAGARSSLLSLWKVDDAATAAFMQSFYEKLKTGQGRADALAATQKEFRNHNDPGWRHPYVWAAFQLSGDWGPIPGI